MRKDLSVIILTKNNEHTIAQVVHAACAVSQDVVVVDSGSSDRTMSLAEEAGARVYHQAWLGYGAQKNKAHDYTKANWVLSIDADEELDPSLQQAILQADFSQTHYVFRFRFKNFYLGKWMKHCGWYPDYHIRLYNKTKVAWNNKAVHEGLVLPKDAMVKTLEGHVLHYTIQSLSHHIEKINRYTDLHATATTPPPFYKLLVNPWWKGFKAYVIKRGFLAGYRGFILSVMMSFETFLKYAKQRAKHRS